MERSSAPIVGIAVLIALVSAVYAFTMREELMRQKTLVKISEKNVADVQRVADDANRKSAMSNAAVDTCNTQLADAQAKLEAALAKPVPRPRHAAPTPE